MTPAHRPWAVVHACLDQPDTLLDVPAGTAGAYVVLWSSGAPYAALRLTDAELPVIAGEAAARVPAPPPARTQRQAAAGRVVEDCTVVICTRGRAGSLSRCLDSVAELDPAPAAVVVVDNGPEDPTVRELVAARSGVTYVAEPRPGLDVARNTGWRSASTPLVAYTDDDVVVHTGWLGALAEGFDAPEVVAVTGLVLPASLETEAQQLFEQHWSFNKGFAPRDFGPDFYAATRARGAPAWELGAGANMAFRRAFLARSGGFDERLDAGAAGCSGDSEMWYRVLAEGLVCRYLPTAVCFHEHRRETAALRGQIRAYMRGHVAALLVQYARYGERGNLRRALVTLPHHYARRAVDRARGRDDTGSATLVDEVLGAASGFAYCVRDPAWRAAVRRRAGRRPR